MEWVERLNQSVSYIEDNLDGEIDFNQAARIACCSTYHYQRMFSYIAGIPPSWFAYANAPDIEVYQAGDQQSPTYRCEVWLPVVKNSTDIRASRLNPL